MGISYDAEILVGEHMGKVKIPEYDAKVNDYDEDEHPWEYFASNGMTMCSEYYDSDDDCFHVGFTVPDVPVIEMDDAWLANIHILAAKFEELTGVPAKLIGATDIC